MKGNKHHIGFWLNREKDEDSRCIDILENLPQHTTACSYIRKAIIFYNQHGGGSSDNTGNKSVDAKLDLILSKLEGIPLPENIPSPSETVKEEDKEQEKKEAKDKPREKRVSKASSETGSIDEPKVNLIVPEEAPEPEPAPVTEPKIQPKIEVSAAPKAVTETAPEAEIKAEKKPEVNGDGEGDGDHLTLNPNSELNVDNFDALMSDFFG